MVIVNGRRITHVKMLVVSYHIPPPILKHIRELPPFMFTKRFPVKQGSSFKLLETAFIVGPNWWPTWGSNYQTHDYQTSWCLENFKIPPPIRLPWIGLIFPCFNGIREVCADVTDFLIQLFESRQWWFYSFLAGNSLHDFGWVTHVSENSVSPWDV